MSTFIMSDKYICFVDELKNKGHKIIPTDTVEIFLPPEQRHADMQILPIRNTIFLLNECTFLSHKLNDYNIVLCNEKAGKSYPENILLNFLYFNNTLYGKLSAIDPVIKKYCKNNNIKIVNVNQGYCRCSTLIVSKNAAITSDLSVAKALKNEGAEVLLISPGNIILEGFDYGFIGGASGKIDDDTIIFFGDITKHPNYSEITRFCEKHNAKIEIIGINMPLTDIGGIVKAE